MGEVREVLCYVSPAGNNKIADWYEDLTATEKADTDEFIKTMRKTMDWIGSSYKPSLKGYSKLGELRWDSGNKKHRLIGFFREGKFVAVMGAITSNRFTRQQMPLSRRRSEGNRSSPTK